jgi:hypothetical protein
LKEAKEKAKDYAIQKLEGLSQVSEEEDDDE